MQVKSIIYKHLIQVEFAEVNVKKQEVIPGNIQEVMNNMAVMKTCKKCGRSLPLTKKYFNENETSKDGYQSYC